MKWKKDELQRRREQSGAWEATIMHREEELQTRVTSLNFQSARKKHAIESSSCTDKKKKIPSLHLKD